MSGQRANVSPNYFCVSRETLLTVICCDNHLPPLTSPKENDHHKNLGVGLLLEQTFF